MVLTVHLKGPMSEDQIKSEMGRVCDLWKATCYPIIHRQIQVAEVVLTTNDWI